MSGTQDAEAPKSLEEFTSAIVPYVAYTEIYVTVTLGLNF